MKPVRPLLLAGLLLAGLLLAASSGGPAAALPLGPMAAPPAAWQGAGPEPAQLVCGPCRCVRRPFWRYGDGRGFFPLRRFGPPPVRRFGYRPFGFGRFGGPRRW